MPYQTSSFCDEPQDGNARLWRYMDLPRLLSVLDRKALFFPSIATLSELDPYEGEPALTKIHAAREQGEGPLRKLRLQTQLFKHLNFFNCWHMNDDESDAMWKLYLQGTDGVAIQSTVERLMICFNNAPDTVYIGEVKYIDHTKSDAPDETIGLTDYMFKRFAFRHECEVRVGTTRRDVNSNFFDDNGLLKTQIPSVSEQDILLSPWRKGVYVDVDISVLIERVVVSPLSPSWFSDLVVSLSKKLGCTFEVVSSEMSRPPPMCSG